MVDSSAHRRPWPAETAYPTGFGVGSTGSESGDILGLSQGRPAKWCLIVVARPPNVGSAGADTHGEGILIVVQNSGFALWATGSTRRPIQAVSGGFDSDGELSGLIAAESPRRGGSTQWRRRNLGRHVAPTGTIPTRSIRQLRLLR